MSDEGRRVFPMETALGVIAGKGGNDVLEFMGYTIGRSVDEDCRPALMPVVRGWLYSLNPSLMKAVFDGDASGYTMWVGEQKRKLGDNLSITPMPAHEMAGVGALMDYVEEARRIAEDKTAEATKAIAAEEAAQREINALTSFKKKADDLEKKVAQLEERQNALVAEAVELKEKLASFEGKVAIDEKEIETSVKDIVAKAVKAAIGGLTAGAAILEGAAVETPDATVADFASSDSGGAPDTFGFGTSGANDDGFGF